MKNSSKLAGFKRRYIRQYVLTMLLILLAAPVLAFAVEWTAGFRIWYDDDPLYRVLHFAKENLALIILFAEIIATAITTVIFIRKPLKYIDEITQASKQLTAPTQTPIELPPALGEVQLELNAVRETALRSAALAKETEQRKNDMIVYLAHDLKTPLTSVIGYLSLLHDEPDISAENRAKYIATALERSRRLEELINEFFDITRFSLTTLTLEKQTINLTFMLEQTISEFMPIFDSNSLTVKSCLQPNVTLLCDPDKLARVFDNILRNAVNYSYPDTEVEITMTADENAVEVTFKNHGDTIPPEKLNRIFEQFFRLDTARGSKTGGAGLGLAIAKEIVEMHGGKITAESADNVVLVRVNIGL